ncbi:hypothetical protein CDIK_0216 [Cucumispora dikerogammari]|nr:hypothetical protein CDIK_0216 [Cucumispora dikerogammari]
MQRNHPMLLIDISYFLQYGHEKTALFLLNIYNNNIFRQHLRFVQSIYTDRSEIINIKQKLVLNELSNLLKRNIKHISFFEKETNTVGNLFYRSWLINLDSIKQAGSSVKSISKSDATNINKNMEFYENIIKFSSEKPFFLLKYIKFDNKEEKDKFYKKPNNSARATSVNKKSNTVPDLESENLATNNTNLTFSDVPFLLQKIGSFQSSLDCLKTCPVFYEGVEDLVKNYANLTVPNITNFEDSENRENVNCLENFPWFDKLFYIIFRANLYLSHEYYDFKIEEILNELFFVFKGGECCNQGTLSIDCTLFETNSPKIEGTSFYYRIKEYKKHYLQNIKLEDSFLDEARIDISVTESEVSFNFDSDTSFNKSIEYIEVQKDNNFFYTFKPTKAYFTNTLILNLPFCLCGYLYNLKTALKHKMQTQVEIKLKCSNPFKLLRSPFLIKWTCDVLRETDDWNKLQILFGDLCLLRNKLNKKRHLCKKIKECVFKNNQNTLIEEEIEIEIKRFETTNWYLNSLLLYVSFINKMMTLCYIYESLPKRKKLVFEPSFISKLVAEISSTVKCLFKLREFDPCDILLSAVECFYFHSTSNINKNKKVPGKKNRDRGVISKLLGRLERKLKKEAKTAIINHELIYNNRLNSSNDGKSDNKKPVQSIYTARSALDPIPDHLIQSQNTQPSLFHSNVNPHIIDKLASGVKMFKCDKKNSSYTPAESTSQVTSKLSKEVAITGTGDKSSEVLLISRLSGKHKLISYKFVFILYQIFGEDKLIPIIQNIRLQHDQLIRSQIEVKDLNEIRLLSLRNNLDQSQHYNKTHNMKKEAYGQFSKLLHNLSNPMNIKCVDQFLSLNKNEMLLIEKVKLLLQLGNEKEALEKLKLCTSHRATNLVNKFRSEGDRFPFKKMKMMGDDVGYELEVDYEANNENEVVLGEVLERKT